MPRDLDTMLWDIEQAIDEILSFVQGKELVDYERETVVRRAVERDFEIIGEALRQTESFALAEMTTRLGRYRDYINFRNVLIHQYSGITDTVVWETARISLPILHQQILKWRADLKRSTNPNQSTP